jgi:cysteine dioxygenase
MKCLDGELVETKYEWPDKDGKEGEHEMVEKCRTVLKKNDVAYICDNIGLHRVENESHTKPSVTLHVYIPAYSESQAFDLNTGKSRKVEITFYSKYGDKVFDV